ncbi:type IV pilus modification protein PilV [Wenzhouxiangella limi]|uniref:Type IV pilus modification protein PilV n=1 Tax=Wenzhouxiangella limi TaxID=2707351 RepID=A0A845UWR7_9GAMM|nr:type IV pilus modification protein PilV [Wenzhouxiangella limi]NDY94270.1 type IV pilus modification protein PilV [Wenzhouxiangella limi]
MNTQVKICRTQRGLTLIEVLVAALVLAIGLAGLAGLNLRSLQASHSAYFSSIASMIAIDAEERAWLELGETGSYSLSDIESDVLAEWSFTNLPQLDVEISQVATGNGWIDVDIEISWADSRFGLADDAEEFAYRTRLPVAP